MRRREFMVLMAGLAGGPAHAQSDAAVVGFLNSGSPEPFEKLRDAFLDGLKETGFTPEHNVRLEFRWARGDYNRLGALASELVERNVTVIAATGGEVSGLAAKAATATIPIVFVTGTDPVERGLVGTMNRPAGNVTGVVQFTFALDAKRLGLLRELVPTAGVVAALLNPARPSAPKKVRELQEAAGASGHRLVILQARSDDEFEPAFAALSKDGAGALLVTSDPFFFDRRDKLVELAARHAVPAIYEWRDFPAAGGLMSYGTNLADAYRHAGIYVGRILKGEKPADLPVTQSTKFEMVINLKTAKALGVNVPLTLLAQADEVIE